MSSDVPPEIIPRPGVVPRIGEPCRAGVVPRETTMLLAGLTDNASPEAREPNSVEGGERYADETVFASSSLGMRLAGMRPQMEKKTTGKEPEKNNKVRVKRLTRWE